MKEKQRQSKRQTESDTVDGGEEGIEPPILFCMNFFRWL